MHPDEVLDDVLERVKTAGPERRSAWAAERWRLMHLDEEYDYKHHFSGIYRNEPLPPDDIRRFTYTKHHRSGTDDVYAALAQSDVDALEFDMARFLERVQREDMFATSFTLRKALAKQKRRWHEVEAIYGRTRPLHPDALSYWKGVYRGLGTVVRLGPELLGYDYALLRLQEHDHWTAVRETVTPRQVAAFFVWDRAGRPGALTTFAQKLGNRLSASLAAEVDPGHPLVEAYFAQSVSEPY
jgi:hypothetical protein